MKTKEQLEDKVTVLQAEITSLRESKRYYQHKYYASEFEVMDIRKSRQQNLQVYIGTILISLLILLTVWR